MANVAAMKLSRSSIAPSSRNVFANCVRMPRRISRSHHCWNRRCTVLFHRHNYFEIGSSILFGANCFPTIRFIIVLPSWVRGGCVGLSARVQRGTSASARCASTGTTRPPRHSFSKRHCAPYEKGPRKSCVTRLSHSPRCLQARIDGCTK